MCPTFVDNLLTFTFFILLCIIFNIINTLFIFKISISFDYTNGLNIIAQMSQSSYYRAPKNRTFGPYRLT